MYEVIERVIHDTSGLFSAGDVTNKPCNTITAWPQHWKVFCRMTDTIPEPTFITTPHPDKPPYRVPSMQDIKTIPWNGRSVVSTFSGAGGSCLGFRMAGYRVLWANEFVPAAQDTYRLNAPSTIMNTQDIRQVTPEAILQAIGMDVGELDVLEGSPPCAAFSTSGKRDKTWGKVKNYSDTQQRVDDLFFEYSRLLQGLQPKTFVAENVSGLVKGRAKGYFKDILAELQACGYEVVARLLDAQWLGVPQSRQRLIFVGVRKDLVDQYGVHPVHPAPLPYHYTVMEAIPWIRGSEVPNNYDHPLGKSSIKYDRPAAAVLQSGNATFETSQYMLAETVEGHQRPFTIDELKRICAFPDDFILTGTFGQQWERLGRAVPPVMMSHVAAALRDKVFAHVP